MVNAEVAGDLGGAKEGDFQNQSPSWMGARVDAWVEHAFPLQGNNGGWLQCQEREGRGGADSNLLLESIFQHLGAFMTFLTKEPL